MRQLELRARRPRQELGALALRLLGGILLCFQRLGNLWNVPCQEKPWFCLAFSALSSPSQVLSVLNASLHGLMENFTLMQSIT